MRLRTILLLAIAVAIALLAAMNWGTLATPTLISLGIVSFQGPLGLVMLGLTVLLAAIFVAYVVYLQSSVLLETRRHTRELASQRELADHAEASRFTELRNHLDSARVSADQQVVDLREALLQRIDRLEGSLQNRIEEGGNATAAYIGSMEDRLDPRARHLPATPSTLPAR